MRKKSRSKQYPNRRCVTISPTHSDESTNTSGSGSDAMLIIILIGTVQLSRFVRGLLVSSEEEKEQGQNFHYNPVFVVRRVGSAIRTLLRMDGNKMGKIGSSGTAGTTM